MPELTEAQDAPRRRAPGSSPRLARHPQGGGLAIRPRPPVRSADQTILPDTTVVVAGNRIVAVGKDGEVAIPAGVEVVDAGGKTLLPGLWDMHVHLGEEQGLFDLAPG